MLGNYLPRQCGIATFTADLSDAIVGAYPALDCFVLAMNDGGARYPYPPRVRFEIAENEIAAYQRAADFLNVNTVDVISVQHEYGIFGGRAGALVLGLLREPRMPVVTTLHTILPSPDSQQRHVMDELTRLSERVVVMLIPHGSPSVPAAAYERAGDVANVTFPCGYTRGDDGDTLNLYYGRRGHERGARHRQYPSRASLAR